MPSTDTLVELSLPRNYISQILDGLEVLIEQWDATAAYHRADEVGDITIRECSDADEVQWIAEFYERIAGEIREQMHSSPAEIARGANRRKSRLCRHGTSALAGSRRNA